MSTLLHGFLRLFTLFFVAIVTSEIIQAIWNRLFKTARISAVRVDVIVGNPTTTHNYPLGLTLGEETWDVSAEEIRAGLATAGWFYAEVPVGGCDFWRVNKTELVNAWAQINAPYEAAN